VNRGLLWVGDEVNFDFLLLDGVAWAQSGRACSGAGRRSSGKK
jgi:hypothetical protein